MIGEGKWGPQHSTCVAGEGQVLGENQDCKIQEAREEGIRVKNYWGEEEEKGRGRPFPLRGALGPSTLLSCANWDIKWEYYVSH